MHLHFCRLYGTLHLSSQTGEVIVDLGLYSFGDIGPDPETGRAPTPQQRVKQLIEEIELADQVGLDWFGVGEHRRPDYVVSSYATVLAAAAARTSPNPPVERGQAFLSSDSPYASTRRPDATLDLHLGRSAEIMAGRVRITSRSSCSATTRMTTTSCSRRSSTSCSSSAARKASPGRASMDHRLRM